MSETRARATRTRGAGDTTESTRTPAGTLKETLAHGKSEHTEDPGDVSNGHAARATGTPSMKTWVGDVKKAAVRVASVSTGTFTYVNM